MMRTERLTAYLMQEHLARQEERLHLFEQALQHYAQEPFDDLFDDGDAA